MSHSNTDIYFWGKPFVSDDNRPANESWKFNRDRNTKAESEAILITTQWGYIWSNAVVEKYPVWLEYSGCPLHPHTLYIRSFPVLLSCYKIF